MIGGYTEEASAWRDWLLRAVAGEPARPADHVRAGRRAAARPSSSCRGCPGYEGSQPGAHRQRGVGSAPARRLRRGDGRAAARRRGAAPSPTARRGRCSATCWSSSRRVWSEPDEGIWEVRGPRRHFTHSKVMAWVAFDRAIAKARAVRPRGRRSSGGAPLRDAIHDEVCREGFDAEREHVHAVPTARRDARREPADAAAGRLPAADDPRMRRHGRARSSASCCATASCMRYPDRARRDVDGLPRRRGRLPAVHVLARRQLRAPGPRATKRATLFERLLAVRNDVGLLAEEYDRRGKRLLGNFPQAFSHVSLVNTAPRTCRTRTVPPPIHRSMRRDRSADGR